MFKDAQSIATITLPCFLVYSWSLHYTYIGPLALQQRILDCWQLFPSVNAPCGESTGTWLFFFTLQSVNYHSNGKSQHVPYFSWGIMGFHSFFLRFKARLLFLSGATLAGPMGPRSVRKYFRLERDLHRATTYADYRKAEEAQEMVPSEHRSGLCLFCCWRSKNISIEISIFLSPSLSQIII